ncbi:MAG: agmatinase [Okeania sp. SIO3C4]|nr:agmatinase [Okeania sp. SIO3C4]
MSAIYPTSHLPFIGSEIEPDYTTAKVAILPIPYEATTTYRRGCVNGPSAILDASQQLECYDEELDRETGLEVGIYTHESIADTRNGKKILPLDMLKVTQETVEKLVNDGKFVIAIGGEHSITNGIVKAYQKIYMEEKFTVIQIDAHGDLRYEYEDSIYNHACVMRRIIEMGLPTIQIGIRAICKEEANLIKEKNLTVFRAREIVIQPDWIERAIASIQTQRVFLTIDLDGIDPTLIPGVGTPEPGGLNWYSLTTFLRKLFELHEVVGCDIMELAPVTDSVVSEFTAAKLVYKLIGYQALAQGW